ncbi:MraY family glycosyltransferase [Nitrosococcus wardiae]|uniref:Undecaprenyl-phosphate alpha-N-acetylglucosaminyl 1-phosphate transferase n=1 Tax=Nitrosococcus wardiae TaxID=1814290 RepID=A0A4P7C2J8_9GAMM|nr:MraY family glycosyltransferase [Nitrosococcus wardiae]QBQ55959.1 undecaprenyl/decaprenyl-phosphate alpha-N-acetylglucosaminyl 1-phosphate transferase [Nitrosococcus wardiae]
MDSLPYFLGFGVTALLIWVSTPLAFRIGLVDRPGGRKNHRVETPLVGGAAMFCGFLFAVLSINDSLSHLRPFFAGSALLVIIGILDDFRELPVWVRFLSQVIAALLMTVGGGVVVENLGFLFDAQEVHLGAWAVPFTVFGVVGVINAFNMSDGMDGLSGMYALTTLLFLAWAAANGGMGGDQRILLVLVSVVAGFLAFNYRFPGRHRALAFMGDAGSMFLGYALVWFLVSLSQKPAAPISPVTALWLVALPLLDTASITLRRILKGRSPFAPDREHFHHIFLVAGWSVPLAVNMMVTMAFTLAGLGFLGHYTGVSQWLMFYAFLGVFLVYFWGVRRAWKVMRALSSSTYQPREQISSK